MKQQRMTHQKQLILDITQKHHDHPTADELYLEVRSLDDKISRGTVYRNLEQLSESGHLLRVKLPGADRYDSRLDYHYHLVCKGCGLLCDAPWYYDGGIDRQLSKNTGFLIYRHRTIFEGLCPACVKARSSHSDTLSQSRGPRRT